MSAGDDFRAAIRPALVTALYDVLRAQIELGKPLAQSDLTNAVDRALDVALVKDLVDHAEQSDATAVTLSTQVAHPDPATQAQIDAWDALRSSAAGNAFLHFAVSG